MKVTSKINALKIPFQIPIAPGKTLDRFVYAYIVSGNQTCLIDSGVSGSETIIFDLLDKQHENISIMVLTHAHPDHIGAAKAIKEKSGCVIAAHSDAQIWVENIEQQYNDRPVPGFHKLVGGSVTIDRILKHGDAIDLGDISLQVIHTPGHSRCSISLFCEEEGVLFSGDAIPQGNDLPVYDDVEIAVESIRKLKRIEGIKHILTSWSDPQLDADPNQIMENGLLYFQKIHSAISQLPDRESIKDPMNLCRQMVDKLGLPEVAVNPLIARSFSSHLPMIDQEKL